ncbi:unnamed protein product [marine sediment metagenome]|uniref:PIN domain-containing protein n=1 Tax=marine sediment metagenome TaxID=412755 RepID=X1I778_9ZZZZ
MRILLDTNIVIHREAATVVNEDIGILFKWLDNLHHIKCIHPMTVEEQYMILEFILNIVW